MADGAVSFDSSGDYLTITSANMDFTGGVGFTVEFFYSVANLPTADVVLFGNYTTLGTYAIRILLNSSGGLQIDVTDSTGVNMGSSLTSFQGFNVWRHVAVSGTGLSGAMYVNGTPEYYASIGNQMRTATAARIAYQASGRWAGAISNLRIVKGGDPLYSASSITVPTSRLTAVSNTVLLTCVEHNSLTDQSGLNQTITQTGSPTPILSSPFTNYFGVISQENFNPYSNIPDQSQRWQTFDNRSSYS